MMLMRCGALHLTFIGLRSFAQASVLLRVSCSLGEISVSQVIKKKNALSFINPSTYHINSLASC